MNVKVAVIVLADTQTQEGLGRVYNALSAVQEFKAAGDTVQLFFDGAGTRWPGVLAQEDHMAHALYEDVRTAVTGACGGCAAVFGAQESVASLGISLIDETNGQPSYRRMLSEGYQVLTF